MTARDGSGPGGPVDGFLYLWLPAHGEHPRRCFVYHVDGDAEQLRAWADARGMRRVKVRTEHAGVPVFPFLPVWGENLRHCRRNCGADQLREHAARWDASRKGEAA